MIQKATEQHFGSFQNKSLTGERVIETFDMTGMEKSAISQDYVQHLGYASLSLISCTEWQHTCINTRRTFIQQETQQLHKRVL